MSDTTTSPGSDIAAEEKAAVGAVETLAPIAGVVAPSLESRVAALEAQIEKWAPIVEELTEVSQSAWKQGYTIKSVLAALAKQLFGVTL